eukprot:2373902-Alexandrium_andersonii.AAC.1
MAHRPCRTAYWGAYLARQVENLKGGVSMGGFEKEGARRPPKTEEPRPWTTLWAELVRAPTSS